MPKGVELGKRLVLDVGTSDGDNEDKRGSEKKSKQKVVMVDICGNSDRVVLDDQHFPPQ